jgi:hypothetical protein
VHRPVEIGLALLLGCTGMAKIVGGHHHSFVLSPVPYYLVATAEIVLAVGLFQRQFISAVVAGALLLSAGGAASLALSRAPCGCLGAWIKMERRGHAVLTGLTGLSALLLLKTRRPTREVHDE